jgi:hypothetical protein
MRTPVLAFTALLLASCIDHTASSLVGTMSLTVTPEGGSPASVHVDGPPGKLRAQIDDDGDRCTFWVEVSETASASTDVLWINTYADQIPDLLAGKDQTIAAVSNQDRSIVVNSATVFYAKDGHGYSTAGTVHVAALPAPPGLVKIDFTGVVLDPSGGTVKRTLEGSLEATYVGATVLDETGKRACASLAEIPPGLIY